MNISLSPRHTLVFEFAKALVHQNGPALVDFSVKYDYTWAGLQMTMAVQGEIRASSVLTSLRATSVEAIVRVT
jgi:hypothetical protein